MRTFLLAPVRLIQAIPMASLLALGLLVFATPALASITVTYDYTFSEVDDVDVSGASDFQVDTLGTTTLATLTGFSSQTDSVFGPTSLSVALDQTRQGGLEDFSLGYVESFFTADIVEAYSISGDFTNSAGFTYLHSYLYDNTLGTYLFNNWQANTEGTTLSLGNEAGDDFNHLEGSLTGMLEAGHDYQWWAFGFTQAYPSGDNGAQAFGSVSLQLGANGQVPEPTTLMIWSSLGMVALIGPRRRRKIA